MLPKHLYQFSEPWAKGFGFLQLLLPKRERLYTVWFILILHSIGLVTFNLFISV